MDFLYGSAFRDGLPEAYERLILDAMLGDATLFTRSDEIEEQWALVDAIVAGVAARPRRVPELRGRDVGAAVVRRARSTATAAPGGATDAEAPPSRGVVGRRRLDRADRDASSRSCVRRDDRGRPEPAHERDDAHRVGAARVARRGRADARGLARAASVAHGHPGAAARRGRRASTPTSSVRSSRSASATSCGEVIELGCAATAALAPASIVLPLAISDLPVFLPLARRSRRSERRSGSSSSTSPTA